MCEIQIQFIENSFHSEEVIKPGQIQDDGYQNRQVQGVHMDNMCDVKRHCMFCWWTSDLHAALNQISGGLGVLF